VAGFVCGVEEKNPNYLSACKNLPQYRDTGYCILHFPGEEKREDFEQVKQSKLAPAQQDYDFSGTVFPKGTSDFSRFVFDGNADFTAATFIGEADFSLAQFSGERTSFARAQFGSALTSFPEARFIGEGPSFSSAQFSGERTSFIRAQFSGESTSFTGADFSGERTDFRSARFSSGKGASFTRARFMGERTLFTGAQFGSALTSFLEAIFTKEVDFTEATVKENAFFWGSKANPVFGSEAWARFNRCRIEKPEQFTFNTVLLHPGWFTNVDVRKVDFTDVKWYGMPRGPEGTIKAEIKALEERGVDSPHTLLSQACRRLSANAEENREYPLANEFYYWSMNALRKEGWRSLGATGTLYWALSGYGVRATRAFLVLVGICVAFAAFYTLLGPTELNNFWTALGYSLGALARLNPNPRPDPATDPGLFQVLVIVEGLLGPLQIALLVLAIRRKVMR
jgi:uncharacterized protein YjbI with pentapeptide repeats